MTTDYGVKADALFRWKVQGVHAANVYGCLFVPLKTVRPICGAGVAAHAMKRLLRRRAALG